MDTGMSQRVIDRARAVAASWEQWCNASPDDQVVMWGFIEGGMKRLITALDEMGKPAVRPEVAAILDQDIAEHGELWQELANK